MGMMQRLRMEDPGWDISIYYTVDDRQKKEIEKTLKEAGCEEQVMESIRRNLEKAATDTGFTYSHFAGRFSIVVIHKASSIGEFINTFEHERTHLQMHICEAMDINPYSEQAAHMSGDIAQLIMEKALCSIIEL